jgi:hypothetical protein
MNTGNKFYIKFLLLILIFAICPGNIYSQPLPGGIKYDQEEAINEKKFADFSVIGKFQKSLSNTGFELGGRLGMTNDNLSYGFAFFTLLTKNLQIKTELNQIPAHLRLNYGGANIGYNISPFYDFYIVPELLIGLGNISSSIRTDVETSMNPNSYWLFIAEPGLRISYDIIKEISIGIAMHYRISAGSKLPGASNSDLSGLGFSIVVSSKQFLK